MARPLGEELFFAASLSLSVCPTVRQFGKSVRAFSQLDYKQQTTQPKEHSTAWYLYKLYIHIIAMQGI